MIRIETCCDLSSIAFSPCNLHSFSSSLSLELSELRTRRQLPSLLPPTSALLHNGPNEYVRTHLPRRTARSSRGLSLSPLLFSNEGLKMRVDSSFDCTSRLRRRPSSTSPRRLDRTVSDPTPRGPLSDLVRCEDPLPTSSELIPFVQRRTLPPSHLLRSSTATQSSVRRPTSSSTSLNASQHSSIRGSRLPRLDSRTWRRSMSTDSF